MTATVSPSGRVRPARRWRWLVGALIMGLLILSIITRSRWWPMRIGPVDDAPVAEATAPAGESAAPPAERVLLSATAQKNLRMVSKPLRAETFWKTITVPGIVIDRPGHSDRGIVAPVTGIIRTIHRQAGDIVQPGETLFTVRLLSETLHQTQTDLFKATQDIQLAQSQKQRLQTSGGAVPESRIIEVDNQITRLQTAVKAYRQELQNRGLLPEQIDGVMRGTFVVEIPIIVPNRPGESSPSSQTAHDGGTDEPRFELQEIGVVLGQQVQAGQTLCQLANHQLLALEGQAFRDELPLLERSFKENWPVAVDFGETPDRSWPALMQSLAVGYIANNFDPETRTFRFLIPLVNQSQIVEHDGRPKLLWRYRPGQRVRLSVRVESLDNVFVLPPAAVVREGADAYVFRRNIDMFDRKPVHVIYQDRQHVVIANDGSIPPGIHVAQTGATQLNRMMKAQTNTLPKGFHIHADGSVHYGSDE